MEKLLKSILIGLPMVILGACSADDPADSNNGAVAEQTEVRYLKVNLVNATGGDGMSRAIGDDPDNQYANGTDEENKIRTIDFYFYDKDKNYHSHVPLSLTTAVDPVPNTSTTDKPSVRGFYETNVPINLVQGDNLPAYVICIVNAVNASYYEGRSLEEAQSRLLSSFYSPEDGGNKYLGMNNSVYYGRDEVTGQDDVLIMATPFDTNKLLTESELKDMTDEQIEDVTIDIYVERYAAKVNFNIGDDAVKPFVTADGVTLTFEPKGWGLNAYEKEFYFIKSYREEAGPVTGFESITTMNQILFEGWNRPDHFRSFWARTPAYYLNEYPLVADDILDVPATSYPYKVFYQSFATATNPVNSSQYVMEATLKGDRLTGKDMPENYLPLTSIPSVVLVGQYKINGTPVTFYTYQKDTDSKPYIYSANDGEIPGVSKTIHDRLLETQTIVLKKVGNGYSPVRKADLLSGVSTFVVEHPQKEVRHGLKVGGDLVTLQIKAANSGFYFYDSEAQDYVEIKSAADITKVNRLLYQNLGGAHLYTDGMAFFSAPIQHWGWQRSDNENKGVEMEDWDWSKMKTGDFGVVRNHVYTIQIGTISGLGTGIIDTDDPLLPPTDKVSYSVKFRVNIQKWATLPTQTWDW